MSSVHTAPDARRSWRRRASALLASSSLLLTGLVVGSSTSPASAEEVTISDGTVTWGVRTSWRNYAGPGELSDGLTVNAKGEFQWKVESGTYDNETRRLELQTSGSVHWSLHEGALDLTLSDLLLVVDGDEPQILADVQSKSESTGEMIDYGVVALTDIDLASGDVEVADGTSTWSPLDTRLTQEGVRIFSGNYGSGALFDPVSAVYAGPGGKPETTAESFAPSGSLGLSPDKTVTNVLASVVTNVPDVARGVVHLGTNSQLQAYDAETLAPIGSPSSPAFYGSWNSYPAPVLHAGSGAIVGNSGNRVIARTWNPEAKTYETDELLTGLVGQVAYDRFADRVIALTANQLHVFTVADGEWSTTSYPLSTNLQISRPGIAVDELGTVVVAEAGRAPKLIKVTGSNAVVSDLPGDYTNPQAQQEAFQYPTEAVAVADGGFRLTNYQGRIYDVAVSDGAYNRVGPIQDTGLSQVLRSSYDISTDTWYLSDWGSFKIVAVRGAHQGELTVKALAYSVLEALPVAGDGGKLYAVAQRMGADEADFGFLSWDQSGISPTITKQPATPKVSLGVGDVSKTAVLTAAATADPSPTVQWQSRPVGSTSAKAWTEIAGETSPSVTVTLSEADNGRQYRALFSNAAGQIATEAVVAEVQTAPAIVFQPESADVTEGDDAQFLVMPKGNPYPSITWQRRVGGYWQDLSDDDDNFVIDGGTLTVKDSNADQSGSVFRARLRNDTATIYSRIVTLSVAEPSDAKRDVASGDLAWGVKESFRKYIGGPIAHGTTTVAGGASVADDGTFRFPVDSGSYDPKTGSLEVEYDGSVHFTGHAGALDLKISDPRLEITGDSGVLVADVVSKSLDSTELTTYDDVELAALDAKDALTAGTDTLRLAGVGAKLTEAGAPAFAGFYPAGSELDELGAQLALGQENGEPVASKTQVTMGRSSYTYGRLSSATVQVAAPGAQVAGKVKVAVGGKTVSGTLSNGRTTVKLPSGLRPGTYVVSATYPGSAGVAASSAKGSLRVVKASARITVRAKDATITRKTRPRLIVKGSLTSATSAYRPAGQLVIRDGGRILKTATLKVGHRGKLTIKLPKLTKGTHYLRVSLASGALHGSATSPYIKVKVR